MLQTIRFALFLSTPVRRQLIQSNGPESIVKRWAGHSKWANIKHQKTANDVERNKLFTRLSRMIKVAIVEGKNSDPDTNSRLQSVLGQCKRANMPASTIANSIKSAVSIKSDEKVSQVLVRGPGRCVLIVEIASANAPHFKNQIAAIMKKHGCKFDTTSYDFMEKGVIIASPLSSSTNPIDDATEHAIEAGVEEVTYDESNGKLKFESSPELTWRAKKALEALGYNIDTAVIEDIPRIWAELTDEQIEITQNFIAKVEAMPEVLKITDNIA